SSFSDRRRRRRGALAPRYRTWVRSGSLVRQRSVRLRRFRAREGFPGRRDDRPSRALARVRTSAPELRASDPGREVVRLRVLPVVLGPLSRRRSEVTIAAGSRLGPYEVLAPIGAGGMGEGYRARDTRLSREVAIKVLPERLASDPERLKRFSKEARAASALNHPSIVTVYDLGESDGMSWIAMELVEGKTLRELLVSGPLPLKRALLIGASVADGLSRAHESGIVHRDLKPENVMVGKDGLVKILDFGLAKRRPTDRGPDDTSTPTETATGAGVVVGTAGYMSPEQV